MGGKAEDAERIARGELHGHPLERRGRLGGHHPTRVGRQDLVHAVRDPQAARLGRALVDRNEDRDDGTDAGVCGQVLVRAESGASGLLVVDLVLEVDHPDSENRRRKLEEVSLHERAEPVVTGRHVLGPADRLTGRGLLRVVTPDVAAGGPCLDVGSPVLQVC